jgi:uncharacterized protein YndB with AHSA1/START domain
MYVLSLTAERRRRDTGGTMPSASNTVTIDRPAGDVFRFLAAPHENDQKWRPAVTEMRYVSGEGAGARYHQKMKGPVGMSISADIEIDAYEPDRLIGFHTLNGPVRPAGRFEITPAGDGCSLTFTLTVELSGVKKTLMGSMTQKSMDAEVANLSRLKAVMESQPA